MLNISIYATHIVVVIVAVVIIVVVLLLLLLLLLLLILLLLLLRLHYRRRIRASLPSRSPPPIPILRYLSPINNPNLSYVILCIIFQSTEYIRADPSE